MVNKFPPNSNSSQTVLAMCCYCLRFSNSSFDNTYLFYSRESIDVNECVTSPCHSNATCEDTIGSYSCECNQGFSGNGTTCSSKIRLCLTLNNMTETTNCWDITYDHVHAYLYNV